MINKLRQSAVAAGLLLAFAIPSHAYVVDGFLGDWGVTPYVNWAPSSPSTDWMEENNVGGPGGVFSGGEQYDAEAIYFDDDANNIYFAIVTSFPQSGLPFADGNDGIIHPGDIALNLYAGGEFGYEYGIKTSGVDAGKLYFMPDWLPLEDQSVGFPVNAPSNFTGGAYVGNASLVYANTIPNDNGKPNYVIEGSIAKSLIGNPGQGQNVQINWTMSCGNDKINVTGDIDHPVPEPATLVLLGSGLMAAVIVNKKRKKQ